MKKYSLVIVALAFLSLAPSALAAQFTTACGPNQGGYCAVSTCNTSIGEIQVASNVCGTGSYVGTPYCCMHPAPCTLDPDCAPNGYAPYCNRSTGTCQVAPYVPYVSTIACGIGNTGLCKAECGSGETSVPAGYENNNLCAASTNFKAQTCCVPPTQTTANQTTQTQTTANTSNPTYLINPLSGGGDLQSFLQSILGFIIKIGSIILILMLVFVGYKFVAAQGEPSKLEEARRMLLWTVVGGLVLLGAQAIASGILATVNAIAGGH
ncbi:MAG: hypothetical protein RLZZ26_408 [Candidatus Parcubacteria bacterium]